MALYFITSSKNKLAEVQAALPQVEQLEIDLAELQELDAHKIIEAKLKEALKHHAGPLMAEDTSLYFDGLNGLPGPFIKWFLQALGHEGLVKLAQVYGASATAKTIIGYVDEKGSTQFFEGEMKGHIVAPRGPNNFAWDVIFEPEGYDKTFAEMTQEQKNAVSMRGKALSKLKTHLSATT